MEVSMRKLIVTIALRRGRALRNGQDAEFGDWDRLRVKTSGSGANPQTGRTAGRVGAAASTANTGNASAIIPAGTTRSVAAATNTTIAHPMVPAVAAITRSATTMAAVISASMVLWDQFAGGFGCPLHFRPSLGPLSAPNPIPLPVPAYYVALRAAYPSYGYSPVYFWRLLCRAGELLLAQGLLVRRLRPALLQL